MTADELASRRSPVHVAGELRAIGHRAIVSFWRPPGVPEPTECGRCAAPVRGPDFDDRGGWVCQPTEMGQRSVDSAPRWLCEDCYGALRSWMGGE